jgi:hypothetical protein
MYLSYSTRLNMESRSTIKKCSKLNALSTTLPNIWKSDPYFEHYVLLAKIYSSKLNDHKIQGIIKSRSNSLLVGNYHKNSFLANFIYVHPYHIISSIEHDLI